MTVETIPAIRYYYDEHPTEEDLMGENSLQDCLNKYLVPVLEWRFRAEGWFIARNLNIYTTPEYKEPPLAPDVAVYKGVKLTAEERGKTRSWSLALPDHPPPTVVFEIASDETAAKDINEKPARYARMGVREYYFYDPRPGCAEEMRLRGWFNSNGRASEAAKDGRGRIWSEELESWLISDGPLLRLYDRDLNLRHTGEEAERAAKERALVAREQALADAEAERAAKERALAAREQALADAEVERAAKERALAAREAERTAKEAERAAKERAWAKLREQGIDPESL
ncbi:MAG TPA: Uma2 family endonuclease [Armatimonadota bacterium]|nr:Uma2 family endonuclease [Armatimonadota bacterium]